MRWEIPIEKVGIDMNGIEKITARSRQTPDSRQRRSKPTRTQNVRSSEHLMKRPLRTSIGNAYAASVKDCEQRVQRLGSTAVMESKKSILALKQEMVGLAFDKAEELICNLPEHKYIDFLASGQFRREDGGGTDHS
jgi:V/A-type H+-transporting ATPase subunit E